MGIGYETAKELFERGAYVMIASRSEKKLNEAVQSIKQTTNNQNNGSINYMILDLSNLDSVVSVTIDYKAKYSSPIDILIENAGLWPREYSTSTQGYEMAFATNVLEHYLLRTRLINMSMLVSTARIIVLTGDIYIMATEASSDFKYEGDGQTCCELDI